MSESCVCACMPWPMPWILERRRRAHVCEEHGEEPHLSMHVSHNVTMYAVPDHVRSRAWCSPLDESWIDSLRGAGDTSPIRGGRSGRFDRNSFSVIMPVIMLLAAAAGFGPAPLVEPLRLSAAVSSRRAVSARMQESLTAFLEDRAGVSSKFMPQASAKFVRNSTSGGCRRS